jgi:hypothetical protein
MNLEVTNKQNSIGLDDVGSLSSPKPVSVSARRLSREGLSKLHKDPEIQKNNLSDTPVAKGLKFLGSGFNNSFATTGDVLRASSGKLTKFLGVKSSNKNFKSLLYAGVGTIIGLSFLKDIVTLPSELIGSKTPDSQAPLFLKIIKMVTGGTLCFSSFATILSGAKFSNPALIFGLVAFLAFSSLVNGYEKADSLPGKLLTMLGLRENLKTSLNDLKL